MSELGTELSGADAGQLWRDVYSADAPRMPSYAIRLFGVCSILRRRMSGECTTCLQFAVSVMVVVSWYAEVDSVTFREVAIIERIRKEE